MTTDATLDAIRRQYEDIWENIIGEEPPEIFQTGRDSTPKRAVQTGRDSTPKRAVQERFYIEAIVAEYRVMSRFQRWRFRRAAPFTEIAARHLEDLSKETR